MKLLLNITLSKHSCAIENKALTMLLQTIINRLLYTYMPLNQERFWKLFLYKIYQQIYRVSKKWYPQFYFCENFRKCSSIFTMFSLLEPVIHGAQK